MSDTQCTENPHCDTHGFNRDMSHCEDRYVCDCEDWTPAREMFDAVFTAIDILKNATDAFTWDAHTYEAENKALKERIALLEAAIKNHREAMWEGGRVGAVLDQQLYAVLQEQGNERVS